MKKIIQTLLVLSLVFMVSCATKGSCPYMKAKGKCESGCTASCDKAKEMKGEMDKASCGAAKCGDAKEAKSCGAAKCGADKDAKSCH